MQWIKLYYRDPAYTKLVDKYEVKQFISEKIGKEYIIPTIGVWDDVDEIDFDSLPNAFVLKCTHDSGGNIICPDKSVLDVDAAKKKIKSCMKRNYYYHLREWVYKDVKKKIIAEPYLEDPTTQELRDYKFFCFNSDVKALFIAANRFTGNGLTFDFFDSDFNWLDFKWGHPNAAQTPQKPVMFDKMKELASELSKGIPHVRVDFYEINGKIYFGEMTFFTYSGFQKFDPIEWDKTFGDWLELPKKRIT